MSALLLISLTIDVCECSCLSWLSLTDGSRWLWLDAQTCVLFGVLESLRERKILLFVARSRRELASLHVERASLHAEWQLSLRVEWQLSFFVLLSAHYLIRNTIKIFCTLNRKVVMRAFFACLRSRKAGQYYCHFFGGNLSMHARDVPSEVFLLERVAEWALALVDFILNFRGMLLRRNVPLPILLMFCLELAGDAVVTA